MRRMQKGKWVYLICSVVQWESTISWMEEFYEYFKKESLITWQGMTWTTYIPYIEQLPELSNSLRGHVKWKSLEATGWLVERVIRCGIFKRTQWCLEFKVKSERKGHLTVTKQSYKVRDNALSEQRTNQGAWRSSNRIPARHSVLGVGPPVDNL